MNAETWTGPPRTASFLQSLLTFRVLSCFKGIDEGAERILMSLSFRSATIDDEIRERRLAELLSAAATLQRQLGALLGPPPPEPSTVRRLAVRNNGHVLFLAPQEIEWIEAAGNYVRLNAGGESHLLRDTMSGIEGKLPRDGFLRIHRSVIANLDAVHELEPSPHGDLVVVLKSGKRLPLSRGCRHRLEEAL